MPVEFKHKEGHKTYLTVAERLVEMKQDHDGRYQLCTELISTLDQINELCVMKATLTIHNGENHYTYNGHSYETATGSYINKTAILENCETSAIGRALAAAGYTNGGEYASADELIQKLSHPQHYKPKEETIEHQRDRSRDRKGSNKAPHEERRIDAAIIDKALIEDQTLCSICDRPLSEKERHYCDRNLTQYRCYDHQGDDQSDDQKNNPPKGVTP